MRASSFSVIVPTHGRSELVGTLLESLAVAGTSFTGDIDVLVVDSSKGEEAIRIERICAEFSARYLRSDNHACRKRNLGLREAGCEYVLFTDSDCQVLPDVFTQHAASYESSDKEIGGVLGLTTIIGNSAPIWQTLRFDSSFTSAFSYSRWLKHAPWGTCTNLSFRRQVLQQVEGFDEIWPLVVYGEDVDLGLRIHQAGFRILCNPNAVVEHNSALISSWKHVVRKKWRTGRADYYLGRKHPAHLAPEFPGWSGMALLTLPLLLARSALTRNLLWVVTGIACLLTGMLCQAVLTARASGSGWRSLPHHMAVILFEAAFELGRLAESCRHGDVHRLWTKFVYAERQLVGERDKRIRQMWGILVACLMLVSFSI